MARRYLPTLATIAFAFSTCLLVSAQTTEDEAKRAEILKRNAEIAASNEKAKKSNAIVERTFKNGNEAFRDRNYDLAISQYDEGLSADPDHPGAPVLLTNKTMALNARAVDKYSAAIKSTDEAARNTGVESAKKDWTEASQTSARSVALLKAAPASTDADETALTKKNLYFALKARADATRLYVSKVDRSQAHAGVTAFQEYMVVEADLVKKAKAQHDLANMLFDINLYDKALAEYKKILKANPDDLDALFHSGQALFFIGATYSDKAKYQGAANYLAKFVRKAPDTNLFKADAKAILDELKEQANVKAKKVPAPGRRRKRPWIRRNSRGWGRG